MKCIYLLLLLVLLITIFSQQLFDHDNDRATTYSGEKNIRQAGLFSTYNDLPNLPYWEAPCDKLRGSTDGKKFGNNILRHEKIYIYIEKEYVVHYRWQVTYILVI